MLKILIFVLFVFALGLGFAWLADRPGDLVVTFNGYQYEVTLLVAAAALVAVVATVMLAWWLVKAIWNSPYTVSRYFRVRRRDRGYQAISTGMIAAGAGDATLARKMNKQAAKFIRAETEPLIALLDAQASLLEGDHESARAKFEAMLDDPELRLLGLRGLYLEAERLGDRAAARHYAGRAADVAPQLAWAANANLEDKAVEGDWDGALRLVETQRSTKQIDKESANRLKTVLLTGKAAALFDTDVAAARAAALEANRLIPGFVPAAVMAARTLFRQDDIRKGTKVIEAAWRVEPHPELGAIYLHARTADGPGDRLTRARRLQSLHPNNPDSSLAVARAALDASDYALARQEAEAAARMRPTEATYLLLADIEEADGGDQGKVRQLLGRAVRAPGDPAWIADGTVLEAWQAVSPVTGRIDTVEWRMPVERGGAVIDYEPPTPNIVPLALQKVEPVEPPSTPISTPAAETLAGPEAPPVGKPAPRVETAPAERMHPAAPAPAAREAAPRPPDDPGVDAADDNGGTEPRRFRLF